MGRERERERDWGGNTSLKKNLKGYTYTLDLARLWLSPKLQGSFSNFPFFFNLNSSNPASLPIAVFSDKIFAPPLWNWCLAVLRVHPGCLTTKLVLSQAQQERAPAALVPANRGHRRAVLRASAEIVHLGHRTQKKKKKLKFTP